jgi:DNA-binding LacI/PurR family transcriptional regulator
MTLRWDAARTQEKNPGENGMLLSVMVSLHGFAGSRACYYSGVSKRKRSSPAKMADIARLAGVATSTVSRALAGSPLVAAPVREQIVRLARERGYVVNSTARNLRLQRTQTLSVVIPLGHESGQYLTDPFFVEMLGHLADEITRRGYGMFLQKVLPPMGNWLEQLFASHASDGVIVIGQSTEHQALQTAAARHRAMVVWGGHLDRQDYCTVGTDNTAGAMLATEHLLKTGRRNIIFLGDATVPEVRLRVEGYHRALARSAKGLTARVVPAHLTADAAYEAMRAFIHEGGPFDAVVAASDVIAMSAIRAITAVGQRVPQDVAVVGFDDISLASHANPPLSTVRQDLRTGARLLVDLLLRRLDGEDAPSATMPAELVVRQSSGAPARSSASVG